MSDNNPLHRNSNLPNHQHRSKVGKGGRITNGKTHHRRTHSKSSTSDDHSNSGFFMFVPREEMDLAAGLITHHPAVRDLVKPEEWIISQEKDNPIASIGIEKVDEHNMPAILLAVADIPHIHGICSEDVIPYDKIHAVDYEDVLAQLQEAAESRVGTPKFNIIAAALARINDGTPLTVTVEPGIVEGKENLTFSLMPLKDETFMAITSELHQAGFVMGTDYTVKAMDTPGAEKSFTFDYEELAAKPHLIEALKTRVVDLPDDAGPGHVGQTSRRPRRGR